MFKKLLAALATVALTAGLSTIAIASASADDAVDAVTYSTSVAAEQAKEEKAAEEEKVEEERATEEEQAPEDKAAEEEKIEEEKAKEEKAEPVSDEAISIVLTYITGCAPDDTNTWRIRNPSKVTVLVYYANGGVHTAEPGTTFFETKRNTQETMIISWGNDGSGVKPGRVVEAASGSDLPNTSPSCAIVDPGASIVVTKCRYDSNAKAEFREVLITFDNSKSNVPVAFTVSWFLSFDKTLAEGETFTFSAANIWPEGGGYTVVANGKAFSLPIEGCVEPTKPADVVVTSVSPPTSFDCAAGRVNFTTTTYTTPYVFDAPTVTWVKGKTVEGPMVPSKRAITADEAVEHCATAAAEWPRASSCLTTDGQSPGTLWIHLALDPSLAYSITNDQTDVETIPTSNYTELAVGLYTVRVAAAPGYILSQGAREHWSLAVADSGSCAPNPSPTPTPVPTTGGLSTSPQGASTGGEDIVEASAILNLPMLDLATDGGADNSADNSGVDRAADSAVDSAVDRVLRTGNQMLVNFGYVAIGALTVLLLCALIQLARRYRAAADQ